MRRDICILAVRCLAPVLLLGLVGACTFDPEKAAQQYVVSGDEYLAEGQVAEAVIEYRNAVQKDPLSFDAHTKLGDILAQVGDLGNAALEYIRAADLKAEEPNAHVKAGGLLLALGRTDDTRDRAERALREDPEHLPAQLLLAQALAGAGDLDAAVVAAERAVELHPAESGPYVTLGSLRVQLGETERALEAVNRAIEVDEGAVEPRLALARFRWVTGDIDSAEVAFRMAVELHPDDLETNKTFADFYVGTSRPAEAEPYLKAVVDIAKTSEARLRLADYYARTDRREEAVALLETVAEDPMAAANADVRLAAIDYEEGRNDEAHERLSLAMERSTNVPALLLSAELLMREEQYDVALQRATAASQADPRHAGAQVLIGRIRAQAGGMAEAIRAYQEALSLRPGDPSISLELARLNLRSGNVAHALDFAQEAVAARPADVEARLMLSGALLADGQDDLAAEELERLATSYPRLAPVRVQQGLLAARLGRHADARKAFEHAVALDAENVAALNGLVSLDLVANDSEKALGRAVAWLESRPEDPARLTLAARAHSAAGDPDGAENLLRRLLDVDPDNLPAYAALGQLYWRQDRLDEARTEFDTLAERSPKPASALTMAGILLQTQGRDGEARERFERAIGADPKAAVAANNLAWLYAEANINLDRALSLAQRATTQLPDLGETHDTLGWVLYKRNLAELAIPSFERSVAIDSENPLYHYHLGLAHSRAGNAPRARQSLERALELQTAFPGADEARGALAGLPARSGG